jgi:hypothetical protein
MVHHLLLATATLAASTAHAPASAHHHASVAAIARDCAQDGTLDRHYRSADLTRALRRLPADIDDYTNCGDLIVAQRARTAGRRGTDPARECRRIGTLRHRYTERQLRAALRAHPHAATCRAVLRAQLVGWTKPVWPR